MFIAKTLSHISCDRCGRTIREFCVPDDVWQIVIREQNPAVTQQHLCVWCFVEAASHYIQATAVRDRLKDIRHDIPTTTSIT